MTMLFQKGEDMATNILLVNQKGGVGKTTFADEIAWGLERRGHKVGFGNLDPQGGANHEKGLLDDEDAVNVIDTPGFLSDDTAEYAKNADIAIIPVQPGTLGLKPMKRTIKVITEANPTCRSPSSSTTSPATRRSTASSSNSSKPMTCPCWAPFRPQRPSSRARRWESLCTKSPRTARPPRRLKTS